MNPDIAENIQSQRNMVTPYASKVSPTNPNLKKCNDLLAEYEALGAKYKEAYEFIADPRIQPWMADFSGAITELAMDALAADRQSGNFKIPTAAEFAKGYHLAFEAIQDKASVPETCAVYERIFVLEKESIDGGELLAKLSEEGLLLKMSTVHLIEKFRPLVANADSLSLPSMAYHNEQMLESISKAKSTIEVEYQSRRLLELNRMELNLDQTLINDLFNILGNEVAGYLLAPTEENRASVESAYRFVAEFFSVNKEELFSLPRIQDYLRFLCESLNKEGGNKVYTPQSIQEDYFRAIDKCLNNRPPVMKGDSSLASVVVWGNQIKLNEYNDEIRRPRRPKELQS